MLRREQQLALHDASDVALSERGVHTLGEPISAVCVVERRARTATLSGHDNKRARNGA